LSHYKKDTMTIQMLPLKVVFVHWTALQITLERHMNHLINLLIKNLLLMTINSILLINLISQSV
jgi:hypothetical protein